MAKVMISSTGYDLEVYRQAAIETCNWLGLVPLAMEHFASMGVGATQGSKQKLDEADVYVGFYAHRYGYIEEGYDKAVTEIEFDYAGERGLERLCFLVDKKHPWPPDAIDYKNYERLEKFKERVSLLIRSQFTTVDDFKAKVIHSLVEWQQRHAGGPGEAADRAVNEAAAAEATAPPLPALVLGREDDLVKLKARFGIGTAAPARPLTVIRGLPGVGKTTLVTALAHDPEVPAAFPDGVLWSAVGETPDPAQGLGTWFRALTRAEAGQPQRLDQLIAQVRGLLRDKRMLLIIDDVWNADDAAPFMVAGPKCVTLVTTRLRDVAYQVAGTQDNVYLLGRLNDDRALEMLDRLAPTVVANHPEESRKLVVELEGLPLAIRVAGRLLASEPDWGVADLLAELATGNRLLDERAPEDRYDPVTRTIPTVSLLFKKSTDLLDEDSRDRFSRLGSFAPKPATFDLRAMKFVWRVNDARPTARKLADRGLLEPIIGTDRFQMHALLVLHARSLLSD